MHCDDPDGKFVHLIRGVELSDETAVVDLWNDYYEPVCHLVGSWQWHAPRARVDAEQIGLDVIFDVTQQIQRGLRRGITCERQLFSLLYVTAWHRFLSQREFDSRGKRLSCRGGSSVGPDVDAPSRDAGPSGAAYELEDELVSLLSMPHDHKLSNILELIFSDVPKPEIAVELDMSRRTLDRLLFDFKKRWLNHISGNQLQKRLVSACARQNSSGIASPPPAPAAKSVKK